MIDLDTVYKALKRADDASPQADSDATADAAADALVAMLMASLWDVARKKGQTADDVKLRYDQEVGPKALVLISASIEAIKALATGAESSELDVLFDLIAEQHESDPTDG